MIDVEYRYTGFNGELNGKCRLLIIEREVEHLVILQELADNKGPSVTNRSAHIITQVCKTYQLDPRRAVFLEHALPIPGVGIPIFERHRYYLIEGALAGDAFKSTYHKLISFDDFVGLVDKTGADWRQLGIVGLENAG